MVGEKVKQYTGKNTDLSTLKTKVEEYLKVQGFKVQSSAASSYGTLIQAQKSGFLRDIITADRAFNIMITGDSNNFTVRIGVGKWFKNLGIAAIEALLLSEIFLAIDVPEMLWNLEIEGKILKQIDTLVG
ncbi:MAG: hypothetical protein JRN20_15465 [Nitrososphaerota archaeon]|nr:hypothetical protein [Nitrososphaerota archaeon]